LLHLEFQSGHDSASLPDSLHLRNTLLQYRHHLLVQSVAILLRPEADSPALTGVRTVGFPNEEPVDVFRYQVLRIWRIPAAVFLAGGLGTLPLAPVADVTEAQLPGIIERMQQRLTAEADPGLAATLWSATYVLMGLRYSRELAGQLLQGVKSMKESVTYQAIIEEGEAKGMEKGKALGRAQGALAEARRLLLRLGSSRFGKPSPDVEEVLNGIEDLARLEVLLDRLSKASNWQDLLK
jgi:hypothetical protein